jgi:hypothetical protein
MTLEESVADRARWLDQKVPGWEHRINLDTLDIKSCRNCVLGQLFGSYEQALQTLLKEAFSSYVGDAFIDSGSTVLWRTEIRDRRENPLVPLREPVKAPATV